MKFSNSQHKNPNSQGDFVLSILLKIVEINYKKRKQYRSIKFHVAVNDLPKNKMPLIFPLLADFIQLLADLGSR